MGSTAERVKTTAIVIAYLASFMVVAVPLGMAPTDSTPDTTPARGHISGTQSFEFDFQANATVSGDSPQVDHDLELRVFNIPNPYHGFHVDNVTIWSPSDWPGCCPPSPSLNSTKMAGATVRSDTAGAAGGTNETTLFISSNKLDEVGTWRIVYWDENQTTSTQNDHALVTNASASSNRDNVVVHTFEVSGIQDINVEVSPSSFEFPGGQGKTITVKATWSTNGSAVNNAEISITNSLGTDIVEKSTSDWNTSSDGTLKFTANFWQNGGADDYNVTAEWPDSGNPKHTGTTDMDVNPAPLRAADIDGLPVTEGFASSVTYDLRYPSGHLRAPKNALSQAEADAVSLDWNVSVMEGNSQICSYSHLQGAGDLFDASITNGTPGVASGQLSNTTETTLVVTSIIDSTGQGFANLTSPNGSQFATGTLPPHQTKAWFNTTLFPASPHAVAPHDSWNVTVEDTDGNHSTTSFDVADPCNAGAGEIESAGSAQDGNFTVTKTWASQDYTTGVEVDRLAADKPEYVFNETFSPEAPEPPVLSIEDDEGDVPDGCITSCGGGLMNTLAPGTGKGWARPNGSEIHQDGDALLNPSPSDGNGQYTLTIQGTTASDFPDEANLSIEVMGPYLGTATFWTNNGTQLFDGTGGTHWGIPSGNVHVRDITPMRGRSTLTFQVTWDHPTEGTVSDTIKHRVRDGLIVDVTPDEVTVGEPTTVTVHVAGGGGTDIPDAQTTLFWTRNGTTVPVLNITEGNDTAGNGQNGDYTFEIDISQAVGEVTAHADDQFDKDGFAAFEIVPAHDLQTDVSPSGDLAGRNTEYTLNVTRNGDAFDDAGDDVNIYVLNDEQWDEFQKNGTSALPSPLAASEYSRDSEGNFTFEWRAEAGTYHVYVQTAPKKLHDNDGQVPTFEVQSAEISWDPATLVSKVDTDARVDFHLHDPTASGHDAQEVNGTLVLLTGGVNTPGGGDGLPNATFGNNSAGTVTVATDTGGTRPVAVNATGIDVTNGEGHIDNVSAVRPGPVKAFFQDSETGAVYALTDTPLQVVAPDVDISPDLVCVGVTTQITATVTHPATGNPISGANVRLTGGGLVAAVNDTTNSQGIAQVTIVAQSSNQVNVTVNGDLAATFIPKQCLSIGFDQQTYKAGEDVTVTVTQRDSQQQVSGATILVDGSQVGVTKQDGSLTFQAPAAGDHLVRAQKTGFADATSTLTTEPKTAPAQFAVSSVSVEDADRYVVDNTYTVTGTITNNGGTSGTVNVQLLVGGAVTDSTSLTLNPGQNQQVAFQWTPSSTGDVNLAISADGSQQSTTITVEGPTVPGFELVAVLAALGAAAVVLRRD